MERGLRTPGVMLVALALLGGCGGLGKSAEDRINAAMPVGSAILVARDNLTALAKAQSQDVKQIDDEYAARMQVRALECGHGYAPGMFTADDGIRARLTDKDCFAKADEQLQEWVGMRRIGLLLAASPLRPLPKTPPAMIVAAEQIGEVAFAQRAGIAVVQSNKQYQVIDIGNGDIIHQGHAGTVALAPSPNGRLFVVANQYDANVLDAETGAVLATFPAVKSYQFHWVHDVGAVYTTQGEGHAPSTDFIDFTSGRHTTIPMSTDVVSEVISLPGAEPRFALFGWNKFGQLGLKHDASGWNASLLSEQVLSETTGWSRNAVGLTADGQTLYGASTGQGLQLMPLSSLRLRNVLLTPLRLQGAVATPDPDRLLLSGYFPGASAGADYYLYSISQNTLAKVDVTKLLSTRLLYIPSLHKNAVIDNSKVVLIDSIPAATPVALAMALEQRQQELAVLARARAEQMQSMPGWGDTIETVRARALARMQASNSIPPEVVAQMLRQQGISPAMFALAQRANAMPEGATPPRAYGGPVASLAKDADVEAIGVYQGGDIGQAHGASARTGTVQVRVRRSSHPLVLSLSAYEPVRWVLTVEPGAKLAAVLSSGYSDQEVFGAGAARILKVGQLYAYKRGSPEFGKLDDEVARLAGKRIGVFQGGYSGTSYTVGN